MILDDDVFYQMSMLLVSLGLIEYPKDGEPSLSRFTLTDKGKQIIEETTHQLRPEFIIKYRSLFPPHKKGDMSLVKDNLLWLLKNHNLTEEQVLGATNAYLRTVEDPRFCQQADFFIYKNQTNGVARTTILNFVNEENIENEENGYGWDVV